MNTAIDNAPLPGSCPRRRGRVPVTNSTLYAYAAMRGNSDKDPPSYGPLHDALYVPPKGSSTEPSKELDLRSDSYTNDLKDRISPDFLCFWDPVAYSPHSFPPDQYFKENQKPVTKTHGLLSFREHMERNPPRFRPSHYLGDNGFANYGYTRVNGVWIDPDSEGEIFDAMQTPQDLKPLPHLSWSPEGPRVMSPEEENKFYAKYVEDIVDDDDCEGDPRLLRISPATFARWVEGVGTGDRFVEDEIPIQEPLSRPQNDAFIDTPDIRKGGPPQFDLETGSPLSDYEPPENPSLIFSARGVNINKRPLNYARSYPRSDYRIARAAFGSQDGISDCNSSLIISTPEVYNSEGACEELDEFAGSLDDPRSGVDKYQDAKEYILRLQAESCNGAAQNFDRYEKAVEADTEKIQLHREVFFMKRELENHQELKANVPLVSPQPVTPRRSKKGQYMRYLKERQEQEKIRVFMNDMTNQRLNEDLERIMDGMKELRDLHDQLRQKIGAESSDIGDFVPPSFGSPSDF